LSLGAGSLATETPMSLRASVTLKFFGSKIAPLVNAVALLLERANRISPVVLIIAAVVVGRQQWAITGNNILLRGAINRSVTSEHLPLCIDFCRCDQFFGSHNIASNPTRLACCYIHAPRYLRPNEILA
jgi:hypothetical protein